MAGILDSKKRIMDTLVLPTGRSQAFDGHMRFRYVTLTDRHTFYESTGSNGQGEPIATNATDRIFFEAVARPQDLLCPETDLNAKIVFPLEAIFQDSTVVGIAGGDMITIGGAFPIGSATDMEFLDAALPADLSQALTASYLQQHFLASEDPIFSAPDFTVSKNKLRFETLAGTNSVYFDLFGDNGTTLAIDEFTKPVWQDMLFGTKINFQFLPPINKLPPGANIKRIMPWITSNLDLKEFTFSQYKEYFDENIGAWEGQSIWAVDENGMVTPSAELTFSPWGNSLQSVIPPPEMDGNYSYMESGWTSPTQWEVIAEYLSGQGSSDSMTMAMFPILASGGQLDEVDFAIARACFMGTYELPESGAGIGYREGWFKEPLSVEGFVAKKIAVGSSYAGYSGIAYDSFVFDQTSRDNNIVIQMFEFSGDISDASPIRKLTIVKGRRLRGTSSVDGRSATADVYYVGKLFWSPPPPDGDGDPHFVKLFSILLCDEDLDVPGLDDI